MRRPPLILAAIILAWGAWFTWPGGGQIEVEKCSPGGLLASLSERMHGARFWRAQLPSVDLQLQKAENWDEYEANAQAQAADGDRKAREFLDTFYLEHPQFAPTAAQRAAERLRDRADRIEESESQRILSDFMRRDGVMLAQCRAIITAKSAIR